MRRAAKRDRTHVAIRTALEAAGAQVLDVAGVSGLGCDLVVWTGSQAGARAYAVEVKDGDKVPSARKLTDSEIRLAFKMPTHFRIVGSVEEALRLLEVR